MKFDLVLYSTPPITLVGAVQYIQKRDGAKTYLMLKDIFPQNAVDLGMMRTSGIKGQLYKYFRKKEQKLYALSDYIGCMSQANVDYILCNNPEISGKKIGICPNAIEVRDITLTDHERDEMRKKYDIPLDKKVFVYGGNLGRPQDVPFIINCLKKCADLTDTYFVIAGSGTDRHLLEKYIADENPPHVKLFGQIPKDEYDKMIACCDVGLIFLDHRFTIPNFPSRLLSYMQARLPILACTDSNTDVGKVITTGGFGWWCESNDVTLFADIVAEVDAIHIKKYGDLADYITYFPLDVYEACKKFVETINPSIVLIAETELWPNFAHVCKEKNIPLYIINGRISDKSYPSYLKIRNFMSLILQNYTGVFCQSELDKERFILLGSNAKNTSVMKNLKFEIEKKECDIDLQTQNSKLIVAGSTHAGEEEKILKAYKQLRAKVIDLKLLLAPRHLTRLNEVKELLKSMSLRYGLKSQGNTFQNHNIIILDTLGELSKLYALADIAYIGGSFANIGGHNPLEALIYSVPVISGPSIKNFRDIYSILQRENAAFVVNDEKELYKTLEKLIYNYDYYKNISNNCKNCFTNNQGALEFIIKKLKEILKED